MTSAIAVNAEASVEKPRHRDFVGGVQHDRQAALGLERAVGEAQAGKRVGVRHVEIEAAGADADRAAAAAPAQRSGYENAY